MLRRCRPPSARRRSETRWRSGAGRRSPTSPSSRSCQGEIARLDELRLTALEDRLEAEVELGRHDEAIAAATSLHSLHTDRERVCRLTMLALHRAGRQQDALDTYEATRRALDEQWGLEPSPETRALQMMILTQDPAIAPASP